MRYTLTAYVYDCPAGETDSMKWFEPVITFDCMEHEVETMDDAAELAYQFLLLEQPDTDLRPEMLSFP